jgi:hypothetical protein
VPLTIFIPTKFRWSTFFSSTGLHCSGCQRRPAEGHVGCHKYFADPLIFLRSAFAISRIPAGTLRALLVPKIFHWSNGFSSTTVCCCSYPGVRMTSTSRAKNISLVQCFLIGWRTRFPTTLRWFRLGSARAGLQLPMHCSNRRPYSLISLQVATAQMVAALLGIRPESRLPIKWPTPLAGCRRGRAFIRR